MPRARVGMGARTITIKPEIFKQDGHSRTDSSEEREQCRANVNGVVEQVVEGK